MIMRSWRGRAATQERAHEYAAHLAQDVFPRLREIDGHRGAWLLRRHVADGVEVLVLTAWESMAAIRAFAGDDPARAVVEPPALAALADTDATVAHYEVVLAPDG